MKISKSSSISNQYFGLLGKLYGESDAVMAYINDTHKGLEKLSNYESFAPVFFHTTKQSDLVGHIALIPFRGEEAFFGFYESENEECFALLWQNLINEANRLGLKKLFGPVNGTIWHPYRFVSGTSNEPYFPSEPISRIEYASWIANQKPAQIIEYHSAFRTDYTPILLATKSAFETTINNGIEIAIEAPSAQNIEELYKLALEVFSQNPGYAHLSIQEFISLYSSDKLSKSSGTLYTAREKNKLLGFCFNMEFGKTLIMKTIAVLPNLQQKGIGNALVHRVHVDAVTNGFSKIIYALVRKDNNVKHFPTDKITVFREYSAYLFNL
jgi:predicted GNAT family acetyltransferase